MPFSEPPSSLDIPGHTPTNAPYYIGILVFAGLIVGMLYLRQRSYETAAAPVGLAGAQASAAVAATAHGGAVQEAKAEFSLPPPPEDDAAPSATASTAGPASAAVPSGAAPASDRSCQRCGGGDIGAALESAVVARAGGARGCYNRARRSKAATGTLTVELTVGGDGTACGASVVDDTVGEPATTECVLKNFQTTSYPPPAGGCVVIKVPISFQLQ